jgi:Ca2+-binding EF-hand superfamily protein
LVARCAAESLHADRAHCWGQRYCREIAPARADECPPGQGMMGQGMMGQGMMGQGMMGQRQGMHVMMILMDTDDDGALSLEEVQAAHAKIFKAVDADKNGKVTLEEIQTFFGGGSTSH